jgi:hypothetical protein
MTSDPGRPIVYLASYPRSGNTFLRALLANLESGLDRPLSAEEIAFYGAGEKSETLWLELTGTPAETRSFEQEWRARGAYMDRLRARPGVGPVMLKTHTLNGVAFGLPSFEIRPDDHVVYIVRHPLDVLVSAASFYGIQPPAMAERLLTAGAFNAQAGRAPFETTGSWLENVAGWLNETRCPITLVRYSDLLANPSRELGRVVDAIGLDGAPSGDRSALERAAAFSDFKGLQQSHAAFGFDQGPGRDRRAAFFREGRDDQWKTDLDAGLAYRTAEAVGEIMTVLGFERPAMADGGAGGDRS